MSNPLDRWANGPGGMQQGDYQNWNQMVGAAPPERVSQSLNQAAQQIDPQQYQTHLQGQPLQNLQPQQRSGLAETLIGALLNRGVNQQNLQQSTGLSTLDPRQMSPQEIASLLQYAQQNHPQALGRVANQYQSQPDMLHAILGNQALMSAAASLAENYLSGKL